MSDISVVVTVLNEEATIEALLRSLSEQSRPADEVIIVDGGSTDHTKKIVAKFGESHPQFPVRLIGKKGNRSVGRNAGIRAAENDLIAITDAGCVPHRDWLAQLEDCIKTMPHEKMSNVVVAGYYDAQPTSDLEAAIVPYVLVMPDRVRPERFLPATRSMLLPKKIWEKLGGFDESLSDNEDYAFARKLIDHKLQILFAANAKVTWLPRRTLSEFWTMIFRFARGDTYSGIIRPKVLLIFLRYSGFLLLMVLLNYISAGVSLLVGFLSLLFYLFWAIKKNLRYARSGWYWLPVLQVISDLAVMSGSLSGIIRRAQKSKAYDEKNSTTT